MRPFPGSVVVSPGVSVTLDRRRLLVVCRTWPDAEGRARRRDSIETIRAWLASAGLRLIGEAPPVLTHVVPRLVGRIVANHSERLLWVEDTLDRPLGDDRLATLAAVMGDALEDVAPVYRGIGDTGRTVSGALLPRVLLVEPRTGAAAGKLERVIESAGAVADVPRSRYLGRLQYLVLQPGAAHTAFTLRDLLLGQYGTLVRRALFEQVPLESPLAYSPDDTEYGRQWNLDRVHASSAWDVTRGSGPLIAVFDTGCQIDHPDLTFADPGLNVDDMRSDGSPVRDMAGRRNSHGTHVAGVLGARINNGRGIAGLAGDARLLPIAASSFSDAAVVRGIRFAADRGADVINMSFSTEFFSFWGSDIPAAIDEALARGCVLCASAGNGDSRGILSPALHPRVIAVGGSSRTDERWSVDTPAGRRGSNYGDAFVRGEWSGVSVLAPAENLPSTDLVGVESVNPIGSPLHGYTLNFWETSAAAPHVAAAAALLRAFYPGLAPRDVRRIIEQSAEKVGSLPYAYVDGFYHGTRNEQMGYGRLHAFNALRMADIYIRDWPGDDGEEPSSPPDGDFHSRSDIVVRRSDDGVFLPGDPAGSTIVRDGADTDHVVYVNVTNRGPSIASIIHVDLRVTPFVGLEFHFPDDWTAEDEMHIRPSAIRMPPTLGAGESGLAAFSLTPAEVGRAAGWDESRWHPCALAVATCIADSAFSPDSIDARQVVTRFNNLAQRNLSVVTTRAEMLEYFPFAIGHPKNADVDADLVVEADPRLAGALRLWLTGSRVPLPKAASHAPPLKVEGKIAGAKLEAQGNRHWIDLTAPTAWIHLSRTPGTRQWLTLETRLPRTASPGDQFAVRLRQQRGSAALGGATVIYVVGT